MEKISAWNQAKVRSKREVIDEARTSGATVHFASLMDICHLKNAELDAKHQKYKGRVVLRGDIVKVDSGSYAVFTEQGSSASQMTAAKIMDIISRLPGCDGQAADAVSAYTQVKMEDAHKLFKIPKSECPDIWIRLPRYKWPKSWSSMEDPVVPLERNLYGHPLAGLLWERQFEKILLKHDWEKIPNWECLFVHREKGLFSSVYVDDIKLAGKKQNLAEIISLDTGLRLDGLPALELWDLIVSVFGNVSHISDRSGKPDNDVHKHHKSQKRINVKENIDSVPSNVQSSRQEVLLYVFEDNEAVIKMIIKGRSPTMRRVSRTDRVALDWLFDRINLTPRSKSNTSTPRTNWQTF